MTWEVVNHLMEPRFVPEFCKTCDWWMLNTAEKTEHDGKPCQPAEEEDNDG